MKIAAKFRASRRCRYEDPKRVMSPVMRLKGVGTFEKRAPGLKYKHSCELALLNYELPNFNFKTDIYYTFFCLFVRFETDGNICGPGPRYLKVQLNSKISFICPNLATVLQKSTTAIQTSEMYENLWFLENKTAFDACDTSLDPKARRLLTCSSPTTLVFSTMIFLQFTAEKDGLVFQGGRTYYLIGKWSIMKLQLR